MNTYNYIKYCKWTQKSKRKFWNDFHTKMMLHTHADTMFERETTPHISHDTFFFSSLERCAAFVI